MSSHYQHDKSRSIHARRRRAEAAYTKLRTSRNSEFDSRLQLQLSQFKSTSPEERRIFQQYDFQSMASYCAVVQAIAALSGITVTFDRQSIIKIDVLSAIADDDGYGVHPPKILKSDGISITVRIPFGRLGVNRTADWCMYIPTLLPEPASRDYEQVLGSTLISCYSSSRKSFHDSVQCMVSVTSDFEIFKASKSGIAILPQDVVEGLDHFEYTKQLSWFRRNPRFLIRTDRVCNVLTLRTRTKRLSSPFLLESPLPRRKGIGAQYRDASRRYAGQHSDYTKNERTSQRAMLASNTYSRWKSNATSLTQTACHQDRAPLDYLDEPPKWKQKSSVS